MVAQMKTEVHELLYNDVLPIAEIIVKDRRREDFGDIKELAASIKKFGLLHPVIVDYEGDKSILVAGERRLKACKDELKWEKIPVRTLANLSPDERREIELEENLRRKDLTELERSKNIVKLVETAKKVESKKGDLRSIVEQKSEGTAKPVTNGRGRPSKPDSLRAVSERVSIPVTTIHRAKEHVEAVKKYPEIAIIPTQKDALTIAKNLDALPEEKRPEARRKLAENDSETLTTLAEKPPMRQREYAPGDSPGEKWTKALYKVSQIFTGLKMNGGIQKLLKGWTKREQGKYYRELCQMIETLTAIKEAMESETQK
jgi:hypothetical protein